MEYQLKQVHRHIPNNDLIEDLKATALKIGKDTITMAEYNKHGEYHSCTLTRRFGSWPKCLAEANLNPSRSKIDISDEELFQNLMKLWNHYGRQPKYNEVNRPLSEFSATTYINRFGSFNNALCLFVQYAKQHK